MMMKIIYSDGGWFVGKRTWIQFRDETKGTHHYKVMFGDIEFDKLKGKEIAVPINQVRYFILSYKG